MKKFTDLSGQKYGRLTVIETVGKIGKKYCWLCRCECGKQIIVRATNLVSGNTRSCGCLHNEFISQLKMTHGQSKTRFYSIWSDMKRRCNNPKNKSYPRYGGRGITVCDSWNSNFFAFYNDMHSSYLDHVARFGEENTQIDRINGAKGYSPDNCRWATIPDQQANRRSNRYITYNGETHIVCEWARILNISVSTLFTMLNKHALHPEEVIQKLYVEVLTNA